jgi:hypothetical protein
VPGRYNDQQGVAFYAMMGDLQRLASRLHLEITDFVLLAEVAAGDTEGGPWNSTALALHLGLPRQTVARKLDFLCRGGYMARIRQGRRVVFIRTGDGIRYWRPIAHDMARRPVHGAPDAGRVVAAALGRRPLARSVAVAGELDHERPFLSAEEIAHLAAEAQQALEEAMVRCRLQEHWMPLAGGRTGAFSCRRARRIDRIREEQHGIPVDQHRVLRWTADSKALHLRG